MLTYQMLMTFCLSSLSILYMTKVLKVVYITHAIRVHVSLYVYIYIYIYAIKDVRSPSHYCFCY